MKPRKPDHTRYTEPNAGHTRPRPRHADGLRPLYVHLDWHEVLDLDATAAHLQPAAEPWEVRDLSGDGRQGLVITAGPRLVAFAVWRHIGRQVELLRLVVDQQHRRRQFGRRLLAGLARAVCAGQVDVAFAFVPETNLAAQLFFRRLGWRAAAVSGAMYVFEFTRPPAAAPE